MPKSVGSAKPNWQQRILEHWDAPLWSIPAMPHPDWGYARARLTAFRSEVEWLTIFEFIVYDSEAGYCMNSIHSFGNTLAEDKRRIVDGSILTPSEDSPDFPFFEEDEEGNIVLNPLDFTVMIRGVKAHFLVAPEEYAQLGINLEQKTAGAIDPLIKILRFLAYTTPNRFFLSDAEMLKRLSRPHDLRQFLQLYDWHYPDSRKKERASDSPCLQSLAKALAFGDPALYECDKKFLNTHWSYWPEWPGI
jgi:hypothetical protein